MVTSLGGDVTSNGARFASAAARSSTLGPTGGSAHEWSWHPSVTRFDTVVMVMPTHPASEHFAAPIHWIQSSFGISYTTRSGVEASPSGSMKYGPGSSGAKFAIFITSWMAGGELEAGAGLGVDIKVGVGAGGALRV